jgi:hypothetical protein
MEVEAQRRGEARAQVFVAESFNSGLFTSAVPIRTACMFWVEDTRRWALVFWLTDAPEYARTIWLLGGLPMTYAKYENRSHESLQTRMIAVIALDAER